MMEYMNYGALSITVFMLIVVIIIIQIVSKDKGMPILMYILLSIMFGLIFFDANDKFKTTHINIQLFKDKHSLKCMSGGGAYSSAQEYRISKKDGWILDKKYFVKDSLMIELHKCEKW